MEETPIKLVSHVCPNVQSGGIEHEGYYKRAGNHIGDSMGSDNTSWHH